MLFLTAAYQNHIYSRSLWRFSSNESAHNLRNIISFDCIYGFDRLQSRIASLFHWFWWLVGDAVFTYAGTLNWLWAVSSLTSVLVKLGIAGQMGQWVCLSGVVQIVFWFNLNAHFIVVYRGGLVGYAKVLKNILPPSWFSGGQYLVMSTGPPLSSSVSLSTGSLLSAYERTVDRMIILYAESVICRLVSLFIIIAYVGTAAIFKMWLWAC